MGAVWQSRWLELVPHFHCNSGCTFCFRPDWLRAQQMPKAEAARRMQEGRAQGREGLWIGGGEPTLWKALPQVIAAGRKIGYERVLIQTNGWALSKPDYLQTLLDAGLTDVRVSLYAAPGPDYDAITQVAGATDYLKEGLRSLAQADIPVEADLLLHREHLATLPRTVDWLLEQTITRGLLWFVSLEGMEGAGVDVRHLLPAFGELEAPLNTMLTHAADRGFDLRVLQLPPCLYPTHRRRYLSARDWDLRVATPGGVFSLEESPLEGGHYVSACGACTLSDHCMGLRGDYLRTHGEPSLTPFPGENT